MSAAEKVTVGKQRLTRESFILHYEIPWPVAVVVPDLAVSQYQMVFRWVDRVSGWGFSFSFFYKEGGRGGLLGQAGGLRMGAWG
jgi:hypothetical protein